MRIGQATDRKSLVAALEAAKNSRIEKRRGYETIWWNNIALVAGDHYGSWNPQAASYVDRDIWEDFEDKKPRIVLNHALTVARTELAKMTKSHPVMTVIANSDEQTDLAAAKVGISVLDGLEWKFKLRKLRKDALWWMILCGNSAIYTGWDPFDMNAGQMEVVIDPSTKEWTFNENRKKEIRDMAERGEIEEVPTEKFSLGEIEYKVYSAFQLLPDDSARSWDGIKDLITVDLVNVDELKGLYPKEARDVRPEEGNVGAMENRMIQRAHFGGQPVQQVDDGVKVYTYWLLPNVFRANKMLKGGCMVRWCSGNTILEIADRGFPYQDNRLPFAFFSHVPSTTIWAESVIQHIRDANLEIDKTVSQLIENKNYMANPMWRIAQQHRIKGEVRNQAGGIIRYTHVPNVPPPEPVPGLQMPAQVENLVAGLRDQILDISGQSEVARGRMPSGVRSGVQVAYMQEEDDTKLAPTVENFEDGTAMMASQTLERCAQFYSIPRLIRYYRRDGSFDVVRFKGADLKGNTDVVPQAMSAMPKSKAAKQQYTLELVSMGILKDPKQIQQMLDLGAGEPDDTDKSIAQANRENLTMLYGLQRGMFKLDHDTGGDQEGSIAAAVPVKKWHNHQLHLTRHYSAMMDEEFDQLVIRHPEIVRLFDEHTAMHEQLIMEDQMKQMQMMEAAKGAPEGGSPNPAGNNGGAAPAGGEQTFMAQADVPSPTGGMDLSTRTISPGPSG